jgi:FtsP/CotA-like multicopper oxidase with cupredoxin domain
MFNDYNHAMYETVTAADYQQPSVFFPVDNNLLNNGVGSGACDWCASYSRLARYHFQSGKTYRLRFVNAGIYGTQPMTVIANDFTPIQPRDTNVVTLGIGQRADVLVKATGQPTDAVFLLVT